MQIRCIAFPAYLIAFLGIGALWPTPTCALMLNRVSLRTPMRTLIRAKRPSQESNANSKINTSPHIAHTTGKMVPSSVLEAGSVREFQRLVEPLASDLDDTSVARTEEAVGLLQKEATLKSRRGRPRKQIDKTRQLDGRSQQGDGGFGGAVVDFAQEKNSVRGTVSLQGKIQSKRAGRRKDGVCLGDERTGTGSAGDRVRLADRAAADPAADFGRLGQGGDEGDGEVGDRMLSVLGAGHIGDGDEDLESESEGEEEGVGALMMGLDALDEEVGVDEETEYEDSDGVSDTEEGDGDGDAEDGAEGDMALSVDPVEPPTLPAAGKRRQLRGKERIVRLLREQAGAAGGGDGTGKEEDVDHLGEEFSAAEMEWMPGVYEGGRPRAGADPLPGDLSLKGELYIGQEMSVPLGEGEAAGDVEGAGQSVDDLVAAGNFFAGLVEHRLHGHVDPAPYRVLVVSVVTNSTANGTALDCVERIYAHLRDGTGNDPRVRYQTLCLTEENGTAISELEDSVQMWLEGYNTYHLVDGAAMKEAWGGIVPHVLLSPRNLQAMLERLRWALAEDEMGGALLTPRMRRLRFRGGAQEMTMGFNTEQLESEFSVVSVR